MLENLIKLKEQIEEYQPFNEQEEKDKKEILRQICESDQILTRDNKNAHITVSAWIVDKERISQYLPVLGVAWRSCRWK